MENHNNPLVRLAVGVLAVAVALHFAWLLIRPLLPFLAGGAVLVGLIVLVRWWRDRW